MNIRSLVALCAVFLVACGGGGAPGEGGVPPAANAVPNEVAAVTNTSSLKASLALYNGRYSTIFTPGRIVAEAEQGWDATVDLEIQMNGDYGTQNWVVIEDPDDVLGLTYLTSLGGGRFQASVPVNSKLPAGQYTGYLLVKMCQDTWCHRSYEGGPWKLPYHITLKNSSIAAPGPLSIVAGVPDWTMFQGNAAHTGYMPIAVTQFQRRWSWAIPFMPYDPTNTIWKEWNGVNGVATYEGTVYLSTRRGVSGGEFSNYAYALSENSGQEIWRKELGKLYDASAPSVTADHVFVAAGDGGDTALVKLDRRTGAELHRAGFYSQFPRYLAPTVHGEGVYGVTGSNGGLTKWSVDTGAQNWMRSWADADNWTPAVTDQYVVGYTRYTTCCYGNAGLQVLDPATGGTLFTIDDHHGSDDILDRSPFMAPVMTSPGTLVTVSGRDEWNTGKQNRLVRFDLDSRSATWRVEGRFPANPVYAKGVVYIAQSNPFRVEARRETDGTLLWQWTQPSGVTQPGLPWPFFGPSRLDPEPVGSMVVTDTHLFVTTAKAVHAISLQSRQSVWSYPRAGELAISASGVLYISVMSVSQNGSMSEGRVVAISLR